ncbi:MAG: hypothetical protein IJ551_09125 [Prevotella sp.]|nr:hypothetical protein [Prevotella sp.]
MGRFSNPVVLASLVGMVVAHCLWPWMLQSTDPHSCSSLVVLDDRF